MGKIRSLMARHRGLIVALVVAGFGLAASRWFRQPRPKSSWDQMALETMQVSPDGRFLLLTDPEHARLREIASGRMTELTVGWPDVDVGGITEAMFLDGGRTAAIFWDGSASVRTWDVGSGRVLYERKIGVLEQFAPVIVSADGSTVAYTSRQDLERPDQGEITAWNSGWKSDRTYPGTMPMALSPTGQLLASADGNLKNPSLDVRESESGRILGSIARGTTQSWPILAVSSHGTKLAVTVESGTNIWDVASASRVLSLATGRHFTGWQASNSEFREDDRCLCLTESFEGYSHFESWDLASDLPKPLLQCPMIAASPDGRTVIRPSGRVRLEVANGNGTHWALGLSGDVEDGEFSRDGRFAAMTFDRSIDSATHPVLSLIPARFRPGWFDRNANEVYVVDATSGNLALSLSYSDEDAFLIDIALMPGGDGLLVRTSDNRCTLWNLSPRPSLWPVEAALVSLVIVAGLGWDWARRHRAAGLTSNVAG